MATSTTVVAEGMKLSDVAEALELAISIKRPVFLTGEAGIGKSSIVKQVAAKLGIELRDVRAVLLDAVDIRGLPKVNGKDKVEWKIPVFLPTEGRGVLFLDELNRAPALVQNACLQLTLDRRIGEYVLPEGWTVIAAGNAETSRGVTRMSEALSSRFIHLNVQADIGDFATWAASYGLRPEVVAFVRFRPELLHRYDSKATEKAFPTPRGWQFVSEILDAKPSDRIEHSMYAGTVGTGAAAEFMGFLKMFRSLPNLDSIIKEPKTAAVPKSEPATLWAIVAGLSRKATKTNFDAIMTYAARLPKEWTVFLAKDATGRNKALCETEAFIKFAAANQSIMG